MIGCTVERLTNRSSKERHETNQHDSQPCIMILRRKIASTNTHHKLDATRRHLNERCSQGRKSHAFDDNTLEGSKTAVGGIRGDSENEEQPCLDVGEGLDELRFLEGLVFDAGFVFFDAVDYAATLVLGEEFSVEGVVGEEEQDNDA